MGWGNICQSLRDEAAELGDAVEVADLYRTPSDDGEVETGHDSPCIPCSPQTSDAWWVFRLKRATRKLGLQPDAVAQGTPTTMLSACSGICAEAHVMEAGCA